MTYFVVDVETSCLNPFEPDPFLFTVGVVPVSQGGNILYNDIFYKRIWNFLPEEWYDDTMETENKTLIWWRQQNTEAKMEAWLDLQKQRFPMSKVAGDLSDWVKHIEPDPTQRFVAANPSYFDKMWIEWMYTLEGFQSPFHYRTLCLRSMHFGIDDEDEFGKSREGHKPEIEHVAWHDAVAEAKDLQDMIDFKKSIPSPRTYGAFRKFLEKNDRPDG